MITVADLINKLSLYASQSPENGAAEVRLKQAGTDYVFEVAGANDARGIVPGQHFLIILPDEVKGPLGVKTLAVQ